MKAKGIRILDKENRVVSVKLSDILKEIQNGNSFHWAILFAEINTNPEEAELIIALENQIAESEKGLYVSWNDLNNLSKKFYQEIDLTVIGCKNQKLLHRYKDDVEMYESCDIVIEMIDSSYWEVFSKDHDLINRLAEKFREIKFLDPDFLKIKEFPNPHQHRYVENEAGGTPSRCKAEPVPEVEI